MSETGEKKVRGILVPVNETLEFADKSHQGPSLRRFVEIKCTNPLRKIAEVLNAGGFLEQPF